MKNNSNKRIVSILMVFILVLSVFANSEAKNYMSFKGLSIKTYAKKDRLTLRFSSFNKKNVSLKNNASKTKLVVRLSNLYVAGFRDKLSKSMASAIATKSVYIKKIAKKTINKHGKYGTCQVTFTTIKGTSVTKNMRSGALVLSFSGVVTPTVTHATTVAPKTTETPRGDGTDTDKDTNTGEANASGTPKPIATAKPKVQFATYAPSQISGSKISIVTEDYYHKIHLPGSKSVAVSYAYSTDSDGHYVTKVTLKNMESTYSDSLVPSTTNKLASDLVSVKCAKKESHVLLVTITSLTPFSVAAVAGDTETQLWACALTPANTKFDCSKTQARMFINGMTINSNISSGNKDVTYALSGDRKRLTITGPNNLVSPDNYYMAYANGLIREIFVFNNNGLRTIEVETSQAMYVYVKNNLSANTCRVYFYNHTKMKKNYRVVLDAGHGGKDSGATSSYVNSDGDSVVVKEKTINMSIIDKVNKILVGKGMVTTLTRDGDEYVSLEKRVDIANKSDSKLFVSVHQNAADSLSAKGTETYYYTNYSKNSLSGIINGKTLATNIHNEMILQLDRDTSVLNRGTKTANFYVIKYSKMPATLAEVAFLTNSADRSLLIKDSFRSKVARAIADAIEISLFK